MRLIVLAFLRGRAHNVHKVGICALRMLFLPPVKEDREMVGTVSREPVRRLVCRCSECRAVVFGDLADFLGGELGGVCDDPEWYAAFEQFQRDFFHGVALATCLTACLTVFHCDF